MAWLPWLSVDVEKVAWPSALGVAVPSVVVPSLNVTVPVGDPIGAPPETQAVKAPVWPPVDGFTLELSMTLLDVLPLLLVKVRLYVLVVLLTVWVRLSELLVKLLSPL